MTPGEPAATATVRLRIPFVYRFLGIGPGQRRPRHYYALDHTHIFLPRIEALPRPTYTVRHQDEREPDWFAWYEIGGTLLRRVAEDGVPATLGQIERGQYLVMPPWSTEEWFEEHPSSIHRLPQRQPHTIHFAPVEDLDEYVVIESQRDQALAAARIVWEQCVEHVGTVLAPSRPPTWCVRVGRGFARVGVNTSRMPPLPLLLPEFHFSIQQEEAALDFARMFIPAGQDPDARAMLCSYPLDGGGAIGGALETARSFGYHACKRMVGRRLAPMNPEEVMAFAGLRRLFEEGGNDLDADGILQSVEAMRFSGVGRELTAWHGMLADRRQVLGGELDAEELRDLRL